MGRAGGASVRQRGRTSDALDGERDLEHAVERRGRLVLRVEARLGASYGNSILAEWVHYGGPPPRGRDCTSIDLCDNPIEIQTEKAVMLIAQTRPEIAWALRARWCGHGRVGVERFEIFQVLAGDYSKRSFFEFTKTGEAMAFNLLFPRAARMRVAA